ncbi:transcriptional regulator [Actinocrinis puniceicyclus]|uniref:Transcriptional regulator n=1 Tax=Actinocrinis puniceicyclus TaxID=977794 RepID=A0A8J7WGM7_9ACTN|nr:MarR family transcriptional regulator [Actinocrinis puniceicyclus]MBS2961813.1 transcriptional regulator [Actinocrinis puniceicyclus]
MNEPSDVPIGEVPISEVLIDVLDAVLYLDKKQIVEAAGVRLHPSETHLLVCAVRGMSFVEIARQFGITKGAVSQTVSRLAGKGIVVVDKDRSRKNTATVRLTPLGESLYAQITALRARLGADLDSFLDGYSPAEVATVARFAADLRTFVRGSLTAMSTSIGGTR